MVNDNLFVKIAHWYYDLGLTQDEIAKRLSLTRQKVNKIIRDLPKTGIVTIQIHGLAQEKTTIESALEERYGLDRAIVAEVNPEDDYIPSIAGAASQYLQSVLKNDMTIGVSWGETLAATVSKLPYIHHANSMIVQMVGSQNIDRKKLRSDQIAHQLSGRLSCSCLNLYGPTVLDHPETKNWLMQESAILSAFEMMRKCDLALFGIGQLNENSTMFKRGLLTKEDLDVLHQNGFVGDICVNPVRKDGSPDNCELRGRIFGADLDLIRSIPNVVGLAGGEDKVEAIKACLVSGVINTLITDSETAKHILAGDDSYTSSPRPIHYHTAPCQEDEGGSQSEGVMLIR